MRGERRVRIALRTFVVLAALAAAAYLARVLLAPLDEVPGEAAVYGATFILLAVVGSLRAVRVGANVGDVVLSVGIWLDALGWLYWSLVLSGLEDPPYPSIADALWMGLYPLAFVALAWQVGPGVVARRALTLDILIGTAGVTAAVAGFVVPALAGAARDASVVNVNAIYLGANVAHVVLLVGVMATRGFRVPGTLWRRLAGAAVLATIDAVWLIEVVRTDVVPLGSVLNLGWLAAAALLVSSVGISEPVRSVGRGGWSAAVVPLVGTVLALAVLIGGSAGAPAARWIAVGAVLLALGRLALAVVDADALAGADRLARTDELTGLVNRRGFYAELRATHAAKEPATLVLADLDRFKEVNDTLGHQAGDLLLVLVGRRLAEEAAAENGTAVVARFGGDEFTVLLRGHTRAAGEEAARRLLAAVDRSYEVGGVPVRCSVSAGAVRLPLTADLDELVRRADVAMYAAKAGAQTLVTYHPDLDTRTVADLARAERVRAGLSEGRLVLHYQPKVDLRDGTVRGVEALARLRDEDGTLLTPGQFLPELDRGGELTALTAQVLAQATAQAARWRDAGTPLPVAINVPAPSLIERFGERVRDALARHDLPGELLYVEVTEESLLSDRRAARAAIEALRALGVRVAVDDYGTGWSSLTYLRELPLDELKLDRSFISGMAQDDRVTRIVRSTVALAHGLDLTVVAEGVETAEDRDAATEAGCDLAQGYLFARPVPADELTALLVTWSVAVSRPGGAG